MVTCALGDQIDRGSRAPCSARGRTATPSTRRVWNWTTCPTSTPSSRTARGAAETPTAATSSVWTTSACRPVGRCPGTSNSRYRSRWTSWTTPPPLPTANWSYRRPSRYSPSSVASITTVEPNGNWICFLFFSFCHRNISWSMPTGNLSKRSWTALLWNIWSTAKTPTFSTTISSSSIIEWPAFQGRRHDPPFLPDSNELAFYWQRQKNDTTTKTIFCWVGWFVSRRVTDIWFFMHSFHICENKKKRSFNKNQFIFFDSSSYVMRCGCFFTPFYWKWSVSIISFFLIKEIKISSFFDFFFYGSRNSR